MVLSSHTAWIRTKKKASQKINKRVAGCGNCPDSFPSCQIEADLHYWHPALRVCGRNPSLHPQKEERSRFLHLQPRKSKKERTRLSCHQRAHQMNCSLYLYFVVELTPSTPTNHTQPPHGLRESFSVCIGAKVLKHFVKFEGWIAFLYLFGSILADKVVCVCLHAHAHTQLSQFLFSQLCQLHIGVMMWTDGVWADLYFANVCADIPTPIQFPLRCNFALVALFAHLLVGIIYSIKILLQNLKSKCILPHNIWELDVCQFNFS